MHPILKLAIAIQLTLTCSFALSADTKSVEVGIVQSVSPEHLILAQTSGTAHIGFIAGAAALRSLKSIKKGQEVRAVFSTATDSRTRAQIGTLLSIRVCATDDAECAADRKKVSPKPDQPPKDSAAGDAKDKQCLKTVQSTLANDPRYGPPLDADATTDALNAYRSFTDNQRTCTSQLASALREAYMNACDLHHCGECNRAPQPDFRAKAAQKCAKAASEN